MNSLDPWDPTLLLLPFGSVRLVLMLIVEHLNPSLK